MNKYLFLCFLLSFMACGDKQTKSVPLAETTAEKELEAHLEWEGSSSVPIYNFNELEQEYLRVTNDTTYVVNFWATWCKPCVKELPAFEELRSNYTTQPVKVVLVSLDFPERLEKGVIPFIKEKGLRSEVVLLDDPDANNWIPKVDTTWSGAIPATIIINKKERKFYERSFTYESLETEIKTLL